MANEQNLRTPTTEQARERGRKGGIASAKAKAKRKALKELLEIALSQPSADNPEEDNWTAVTAALVQKALSGDTKAFEVLRDTLGQKPVEEIRAEVNTDINIVIEE